MRVPETFVKQTEALLGAEAAALFAALEDTAPVSIRLNPGKNGFLVAHSFSGNVLWATQGKYLAERPVFTFDPLFHAGVYYVQEASSMFVEQALNTVFSEWGYCPVKVLDLCAAPGGKSTLAASLMPPGSLLVANELVRTRANILAENLIKWGLPDVVVTQSESSTFSSLPGFFDVVLADVPCSGEGMFRKDPVAVAEWSEENVRMCVARQRDIVRHVWPALRPGGFLVYSTCTFNAFENEENVRWMCDELGAELVSIPVQDAWGVTNARGVLPGLTDVGTETNENVFPVYRFMPHRMKGEGFFLALLRKGEVGVDPSESVRPFYKSASKVRDNPKKTPVIPEALRLHLKNAVDFDFFYNRQGMVSAFPRRYKQDLLVLESQLRVLHAGVVMGMLKGNDWLPDVSLALSQQLDDAQLKTWELSLKQALDYLRREMLLLPQGCPLGWVLVRYNGCPLGWVKNLGSRANNAYPSEWRIRAENPYGAGGR